MTAVLRIDGRVVDEASGAPLGGVLVRLARTRGTVPSGRETITSKLGRFSLEIPYREIGAGVAFQVVLGRNGSTHTSAITKVAEIPDDFVVRIPDKVLSESFGKVDLLVADDHGPSEVVEIGHSLSIGAVGLRPSFAHKVVVKIGREIISTQTLLADTFGAIESTIIASQFGMFTSDGLPLTLREARKQWGEKTLSIELRANDSVVAARKIPIAIKGRKPVGFVTDRKGRVRNAVSREDEIFVQLVGLPKTSVVRVFIVPRQAAWIFGESFEPVLTSQGKPLIVDVEHSSKPILIANAAQLAGGAFDVVVRPVRYGFEIDERLILHDRDIVIGRRHTGLVVRDTWLLNGPVLDAPTNTPQVAGSSINERPYFRYRDTFALGEDIWGAMDPGIVPPTLIGHKAAFYVIASKTPGQWAASTALPHVPPTAPPEVLMQSFCINANKTLVWPGANQLGNFDMVVDFGNNPATPAAFVKDDDFNENLDMIDGFFAPGFRIVNDPGTMTEFANVGAISIDAAFLTAMGQPTSLTVDDENGGYFTPGAFVSVSRTFARQAIVRFPADSAGATAAAQISATKADYPLVVVVHGNGHTYTNYAFLLDHLAANGFIAASIFMPNGVFGLGRANAFFNHLTLLKTMFGTKAQNNVGVLGHSRGGEAVFKIARLNQSLGLGIGLNGMFALAPTDQNGRETMNGPAATPLHVLYGAKDADVSGWTPYAGYNVRQSGFSLYDRTDGKDKSMTFVEDATHNGFVTTNELSPPPLLAATNQRKILLAEANAFFRRTLLGEAEWSGMLSGEWTAPSVSASPAVTHNQFRSTTRRTVDDFEGVHGAASWQTSSTGGAVAQTGLPANPTEAQLFPNDNQSPHDTGGVRVLWDSTGDRLDFAIPAGQGDLTGFGFMSFSATRIAGSASNLPNAAQNFRVVLRDSANNERSIRVSAFGTLSVAAPANTAGNVKSAMTTIRIPLASYQIVCAGTVPVNLADVVSLRFDFTEQATGEIAIDNVEFCN